MASHILLKIVRNCGYSSDIDLGYLGTGKTTLINNLLRTTKKKIALLVNDFGDVNIDESLIEARTDSVLSIAGGCVCCSYGNELIETLESMNSNEILPDHIVLEARGLLYLLKSYKQYR